MRSKLLVFGRFAHDPQSILAAVYRPALVSIKGGADFVLRGIRREVSGFELSIATFADADTLFHDPAIFGST
jgi:hypothetical protein